jgi:Uma2 family endonuclease
MSAVLIENPPMVRESFPVIELEFGNLLKDLDSDEFFEFCQKNREWRIEREKDGEITIITSHRMGNRAKECRDHGTT